MSQDQALMTEESTMISFINNTPKTNHKRSNFHITDSESFNQEKQFSHFSQTDCESFDLQYFAFNFLISHILTGSKAKTTIYSIPTSHTFLH